MSTKRKRDSDTELADQTRGSKKAKSGFKVGPQNLPDGTHRRKSKNCCE